MESWTELPDVADYAYCATNRVLIPLYEYGDAITGDDIEFLSETVKNNPNQREIIFNFVIIKEENPEILLGEILDQVGQIGEHESLEQVLEDFFNWEKIYVVEMKRIIKYYQIIIQDFKSYNEENFSYEITSENKTEIKFEISSNFGSLLAFFDSFTVSEHFPIIFYPNFKKLLKIYDKQHYDLNWIKQWVDEEDVLLLKTNFGIADITFENNKFIFHVVLDSAKNVETFRNDINFFPYDIEDTENLGSFQTYRLRLFRPDVIEIDIFDTVLMIDGFFSRYLNVIEPKITDKTGSIHLTYQFPFPTETRKPFTFYLYGTEKIPPRRISRSLQDIQATNNNFNFTIRFNAKKYNVDYIKIIAYLLVQYIEVQIPYRAVLSNHIELDGRILSEVKSGSQTPENLSQVSTSSIRTTSWSTTGSRTIRSIDQAYLPDFFSDEPLELGYELMKCSSSPRIIKPEKVKEWEKLRFEVGNKIYNRTALPFPSIAEPKYYLGCPSNSEPFIGLNIDERERIHPCCFVENQNEGNKLLKKYLEGNVLTSQKTVVGAITAGPKLLSVNITGVIPEILNNFFKSISPNFNYLKYGVYEGNNSFAQSVLVAMDPEFRNTINQEANDRADQVDRYVAKFRRRLSKLDVSVLRESFPMKSVEEIKKLISDPNVYFDPRKFSPLLEQYFKVNIISFELKGEKLLFVPFDYAFFPGRNLVSDYPLSLIVIGQTVERSPIPKWEISAHINPTNSKTFFFEYDVNFTNKIRKIIISNSENYILNFDNDEMILFENVVVSREMFLSLNPIGQKIDTLGKTRWLIFDNYALMIPAVSAFELPNLTVELDHYKYDQKVVENLNQVFVGAGIYTLKSKSFFGIVWTFPKTGFKIQMFFEPTKENIPYPVIESKVKSWDTYNYQNVKYFRKTAKRLEKLLTYLSTKFFLSRGFEEVQDLPFEQFEDNFVLNPDAIYDFGSLRGSYPQGSFNEVLDQLADTGLVSRGFIQLTNQDIVDRLMSYVRRWFANREKMKLAELEFRIIEGFYENIDDFESQKNTEIFFGTKAYEAQYQNLRRLQIIKGPYQHISIIKPVKASEATKEEVVGGVVSWRERKINQLFYSEYHPVELTTTKVFETQGIREPKDALYIIADSVKHQGGTKTEYKEILTLK